MAFAEIGELRQERPVSVIVPLGSAGSTLSSGVRQIEVCEA